ncbi:MAG: MazG-like family protein [Desulfocucumaceae bacterium]
MQKKIIALPRLDRLSPTMESTALKLMEETGELAQAIGKFRGMNGEPTRQKDAQVMEAILEELLDVAQTAVSMMFVLEEQYNVDIEEAVAKHVDKLISKGYLTNTIKN